MTAYPKPGRQRNAPTEVPNDYAEHFLPALGKLFRRSAEALFVAQASRRLSKRQLDAPVLTH